MLGAPRKNNFGTKKRHCSNCSRTGHTIRRCPNPVHKEYKSTKDADNFVSESQESSISADSVVATIHFIS
ncbi:hypothetical protein RIF29_19930 [Crotalaria pallida]|uniref:CCHC-type domain-containing protein n=1 Tax=Crotalaria pallida TaxID=3830 RepID=A0AAN9I4K3_CROPI